MIDYKVGEESQNKIKSQIQEISPNYNEENIVAQIRYLRDKINDFEEIKIKQKRYTNIILTLIFMILVFISIPTFLEIIVLINGISNL